jgi:hypothetical protein
MRWAMATYILSMSAHDVPRTDAVTSVVYLSDAAPQGLCSHLARAYPAAAQVRSACHTLYTNSHECSGWSARRANAVHHRAARDALPQRRRALVRRGRPRTLAPPPTRSVYFLPAPHLHHAARNRDPVRARPPHHAPAHANARPHSAEGNLVHALDGASPAKLLLAATQRMPEAPGKDAAFFLGVLGADGRVAALHHVVSGDPGRGTMALAADRAPRAGARVQVRAPLTPAAAFAQCARQIFCQPAVAAPVTREAPPADDTSRLAFVAAGETPPFAPDLGAHDVLEWTECVAASERGWTLAHGAAENEADGHGAAEDAEAGAHGRDAWTCAAVGGEVRMSLA